MMLCAQRLPIGWIQRRSAVFDFNDVVSIQPTVVPRCFTARILATTSGSRDNLLCPSSMLNGSVMLVDLLWQTGNQRGAHRRQHRADRFDLGHWTVGRRVWFRSLWKSHKPPSLKIGAASARTCALPVFGFLCRRSEMPYGKCVRDPQVVR